MYQLERFGIQVAHVDRDEHDLWVRTPSGRMLTVQVKTASKPVAYGRERPCLRFHIGNIMPSTDLVALVALHAQVVVMCRPSEMRKRWPVEWFTDERMSASILEHLQ